jgi:hypothetical protein
MCTPPKGDVYVYVILSTHESSSELFLVLTDLTNSIDITVYDRSNFMKSIIVHARSLVEVFRRGEFLHLTDPSSVHTSGNRPRGRPSTEKHNNM